jgi:hypothetical protein
MANRCRLDRLFPAGKHRHWHRVPLALLHLMEGCRDGAVGDRHGGRPR